MGGILRTALLESLESLDPMAELFIVCADRAQHVASVIAPALKRGCIVVCDRYTDATRAYQGGGRGIGDDIVSALCDRAASGIVPHLTLLVDVPTAVSQKRLHARNAASGRLRDRLERENEEFHARVRARYLDIAREEPSRIKIVDGLCSPAEVLEQAWIHLGRLLSSR